MSSPNSLDLMNDPHLFFLTWYPPESALGALIPISESARRTSLRTAPNLPGDGRLLRYDVLVSLIRYNSPILERKGNWSRGKSRNYQPLLAHFLARHVPPINKRGSEDKVAEEKSTPNLYLIEKRVSRRILVHVPIEVTETDGQGHNITERTFIEDVSDFGCRFSIVGPVHQGETIALKLLGANGKPLPDEEPRRYEIMWVAKNDRNSTVGARLLRGEKLTATNFPPEGGEQKHGPQ